MENFNGSLMVDLSPQRKRVVNMPMSQLLSKVRFLLENQDTSTIMITQLIEKETIQSIEDTIHKRLLPKKISIRIYQK